MKDLPQLEDFKDLERSIYVDIENFLALFPDDAFVFSGNISESFSLRSTLESAGIKRVSRLLLVVRGGVDIIKALASDVNEMLDDTLDDNFLMTGTGGKRRIVVVAQPAGGKDEV
ncbi:MAG TPA: hypothetical protein PLW78_12120 [bacterium]|jgi:hypothetical protein|nr:hypothetical protein [bacterium]